MDVPSLAREGSLNQCPSCGHEVRIEPSNPPSEFLCGQCGQLLWFVRKTVGEAAVLTFLPGLMAGSESAGRAEEVASARGDSARLVLDLSHLRLVSSLFLGMLVAVHRKVTGMSAALRLCGVQPELAEVFKVTRMDTLFEIRADQQAALESFLTAMGLKIVGPHPLARDETGKPKSRIGTLFPAGNTLVTLPGIHATQRMAYVELLNQQRREAGQGALTPQEESAEWANAVDLILEDKALLIRPDPENMPLAFKADELLQEIVPKHRIRFLYVLNEKVREAITQRGECWRITPLPRSVEEMEALVNASRIAIGGREIYYYSKLTGTHFLTCQEFARLAELGDAELRQHLVEIGEFAAKVNRPGNQEIGFFMADRSWAAAELRAYDFSALEGPQLRAAHADLGRKFAAAVSPEFRQDDPANAEWRNRMCAALIGQSDEVVSEETLLGLSSEFFMQIQWLPGGRIEEGELIFDPTLDPEHEPGADPELQNLCDEKCRGFIFNFVREYGDLEHINVGRVIGSLSRRPASYGRRDVYIAALKLRNTQQQIVNIIRMQKWAVREHLDDGKSLLDAMIQSEEYTEYILDRRLGCRQLGMNLPVRVTATKLSEKYYGRRTEYHGMTIWSPYFQRDYVRGIASDKIPSYRFEDQDFAQRFADLLGRAAAPNMIVGRCDLGGIVLFDDGDEVVVEDLLGLPREMVVSDVTGTFADYLSDLRDYTAEYAKPMIRRAKHVANPPAFFAAYLDAFAERFLGLQQEYIKRKRAFDTLFKHRRRNEPGSFPYRWERILQRLAETDPRAIKELIRQEITQGLRDPERL